MTDSYISLDLETTGLNPKLDKIIEIGAVKVIDGKIADTFSSFVNPGRRIDEKVSELTGITDSDLLDAPEASEIIPKLIEFIGELPLVGHRILFDYSFVKHEAVNKKLPFEKNGIDTLKISRACYPELSSKRLSDMCSFYKIELDAHRALNDASATASLYEYLKRDFKDKYPELFEETKLVFSVKKDSPARKSQIERLEALIERNRIDCPYDLSKLSRSEATRYYDKLIAKYGK